jgi:hypothetical protein
MRHAKRHYLCDTVEQQFTHLSSLGVKWSQVQILSARPVSARPVSARPDTVSPTSVSPTNVSPTKKNAL